MFRAFLVLVTVLLAASCGSDDEDNRSDAERFCEDVNSCPDVVLLTSVEECVAQAGQYSVACIACVADLPCAGVKAIVDGQRTECDLCTACC